MHHQKSRAQYVCNKHCQNESTLAKVKAFLSCKIGVFKTKNTRKILVIEKFCDFRSVATGTPVLVGLVEYEEPITSDSKFFCELIYTLILQKKFLDLKIFERLDDFRIDI